jgi:predicted membrane protein
VCFLIDEYQVSLKVLVLTVLLAVLVCLWLHMLGWLGQSFRALGRISVSMSWMGFLFFGMLFSFSVLTSWIKGLFCYVAITPNYMNIQAGLTETAEQVSREDYTTRVDTGDFLERIMGFGRVIITFRDSRRMPMMLLVGGIGKKTQALESIRGKLTVDTHPVEESHGGPVQ